jgi:phosphoglycolate phosphatase-like HAD superfamily hydrolase
MRFDTVFFDFDGVLAESERIKTDAFRVVYADQPAHVLQRIVAYHKANAGISRVVKIAHIERAFLGRDTDAAGVEALARVYSEAVVDKVIAAPEVPGAIDFLARHKGRLAMFVLSGTPEVELRPIVAARGLSGYFEAVRGSPDLKPAIGRELAARFGLDMARTVFVGDAPTDYHAARELGCHFVGRVPPGAINPFPVGTDIVPDLTTLADVLS